MLPEAVRTLDGFNGGATTDGTVTGLVQRFRHSTCIDLSGCSNLTDAAIVAVAEKCRNLASLNVRGCDNLTDAAIGALKQRLLGCEVSHY